MDEVEDDAQLNYGENMDQNNNIVDGKDVTTDFDMNMKKESQTLKQLSHRIKFIRHCSYFIIYFMLLLDYVVTRIC